MRTVGIAGAGFFSPYHIRGWTSAGITVAAIADPNTERAAARAEEFEIPNCYSSVAEMLASEDIDILDVASPREFHIDHAVAGLGNGLAVLVQKPVAPSLQDALNLRAIMGPGDRLMVHENWRFRPEYRRIGSWIKDHAIGRIRFASIASRSSAMLAGSNGVRPIAERQPFLMVEERLVVAELLVHYIDALRYLIGEMDLITAQGWRTQAAVVGETAATLILNASIGCPVVLSADMTAWGSPPTATDDIELIGEEGRILFRDGCLHLFGHRNEKISFVGRNLLQESATAAICHFVHCLAPGRTFETSLSDNLRTIRIVDEAYGMMLDKGIDEHVSDTRA